MALDTLDKGDIAQQGLRGSLNLSRLRKFLGERLMGITAFAALTFGGIGSAFAHNPDPNPNNDAVATSLDPEMKSGCLHKLIDRFNHPPGEVVDPLKVCYGPIKKANGKRTTATELKVCSEREFKAAGVADLLEGQPAMFASVAFGGVQTGVRCGVRIILPKRKE